MPRVPQPSRDEIEEADLEQYDFIVGRHQRSRRDRPEELAGPEDAGPYFGALLNSPPFAQTLGSMGGVMRTAGQRENTYSHADREFVDQILSADWATGVVQRTHIPDAIAVGVRLDAIEAIRAGREDLLTDDEQFLARYIRAVVGGTLSDDDFARMEERLGRRGAVEYTVFIAFLQMTIRLHQAFGVPEMTEAEIEEMLAEFRDGRRAVPDAGVRFQ